MRAPSAEDLRVLDPDGQFHTRLIEDRAAIERLAGGGQTAELARVVHGLAGAAGTFGFAAIGEAAMALDDALRGGRVEAAPALLEALRRSLRQV